LQLPVQLMPLCLHLVRMMKIMTVGRSCSRVPRSSF
jgi:hypothetical protein